MMMDPTEIPWQELGTCPNSLQDSARLVGRSSLLKWPLPSTGEGSNFIGQFIVSMPVSQLIFCLLN